MEERSATHWLALEISSCRVETEAVGGLKEDHERPHKLWTHAERLIALRASELALSDAILALNRSLRLRLESIERRGIGNSCGSDSGRRSGVSCGDRDLTCRAPWPGPEGGHRRRIP
jgi:hypothetical protein